MRTLERELISMVRPRGNAAQATRRGWRAPDGDPQTRPSRSNPFPRFREEHGACPSATPLQIALERLAAATQKYAALVERRRRALRECTYSEAYGSYRTTPAGALVGPVLTFAPEAFNLSISYVGTRRTDLSWWQLWHHGQRPLLYKAAFAILHCRRPGRRLEAQRRWHHGAQLLGELGWYFPALRLPRDASDDAFRCRVVRGPQATHARLRFGMPAVARETRMAELLASSLAPRSAAMRGLDLVRVKRFWKLPLPRGPSSQWDEACRSIAEFGVRARPVACQPCRNRVRSPPPCLCRDDARWSRRLRHTPARCRGQGRRRWWSSRIRTWRPPG